MGLRWCRRATLRYHKANHFERSSNLRLGGTGEWKRPLEHEPSQGVFFCKLTDFLKDFYQKVQRYYNGMKERKLLNIQ